MHCLHSNVHVFVPYWAVADSSGPSARHATATLLESAGTIASPAHPHLYCFLGSRFLRASVPRPAPALMG